MELFLFVSPVRLMTKRMNTRGHAVSGSSTESSFPCLDAVYINVQMTSLHSSLVSKLSTVFTCSVDEQSLLCMGHKVPWPQGTFISAGARALRQKPASPA